MDTGSTIKKTGNVNEDIKISKASVYVSERRLGGDRRQRDLPALKKMFFIGRRRSVRRFEDRNRIVIFDLYNPALFIIILIILGLSLIDAVLTLILLSEGAKEYNLVMQYYLDRGTGVFIIVKYGLTAVPLLFILFTKEHITHRFHISVERLLYIFLSIFCLVIIWELYLIFI